jgi:hypothetical protein
LLHTLTGLISITNNSRPALRHSPTTTLVKALRDQEMQASFNLTQTAMFHTLPSTSRLTLPKTVILMRLPLQLSNLSLGLSI